MVFESRVGGVESFGPWRINVANDDLDDGWKRIMSCFLVVCRHRKERGRDEQKNKGKAVGKRRREKRKGGWTVLLTPGAGSITPKCVKDITHQPSPPHSAGIRARDLLCG